MNYTSLERTPSTNNRSVTGPIVEKVFKSSVRPKNIVGVDDDSPADTVRLERDFLISY